MTCVVSPCPAPLLELSQIGAGKYAGENRNESTIQESATWVAVLTLSIALSGAGHAAPGDILFSDDFEDGTLASWTTSNGSRSGVSNNGGFAGSGAFGAFTRRGPVTVTSPTFNAAVPGANLSMWIRRGADAFSEDTDGGEDLVVEYRDAGGSWNQIISYPGSGTNGQVYNLSFSLPAAARHGTLAIRVRQTSGSGVDFDYWHFDAVVITETTASDNLTVGSCDDFESGLGDDWSVLAGSGFAGISSATASSPSNSLFLNGGIVDVESTDIDTDDITFSSVSVWIRRGSDAFSEDPDVGENLVVEYRDDTGAWVTLETFNGAGAEGQVLTRTYAMPDDARHNSFRLRFRMTGGSGAPWDFWHVDDVCLDQNPDPIVEVEKVQSVFSDPINGGTNPHAIPGAIVEYTVTVTNLGIGVVDTDTLVVTDQITNEAALYVQAGAGDAIEFIDGSPSSGLSYNFATDVSYTNNPGGVGPFNYTPTPDADGFDPAVTGFQVEPANSMLGNSGSGAPNFDIVFRVRIE